MPIHTTAIAKHAKAALASPLLRGFGAFGSAELANRAVRLVTTVIIARQLAPEIVGEAALALTLFELVRILGGIGLGQRIVMAGSEELQAVCNTARALFWIWSGVMVTIQLCVAGLLALAFGQTDAAAMLALLALVYVLMPAGQVQCFLAMREGLNGRLARATATQAICDHILTAMLLLIWPSPWSIIAPKMLTAPVWLLMTRRNRPWKADQNNGRVPVGDMIRYGGGVLASEGLTALRQQGDNLIIVATMGSAALGTYYFAFNAGLGIAMALVGAFGTVSFPLLCRAKQGAERRESMRHMLLVAAMLFVPLFAAQSFLASYYVPIVFGAHWAFAAPLVAILSLGGVAQLISVMNANWLRAEGKVALDAGRSLFACVCALGGLFAGTLYGSLEAAAIGLVLGNNFAAILAATLNYFAATGGTAFPVLKKEKTA